MWLPSVIVIIIVFKLPLFCFILHDSTGFPIIGEKNGYV